MIESLFEKKEYEIMFNKFCFYDMNDQLHSMSCGSSDMTTIDIRQEEGMVELMR